MVRSFTEFAPIARYDGHPWYTARIQEAPDADGAPGTWETIDTIDLSTNGLGLDTDPTQPAVRNLTTENASDDTTAVWWYRIVFVDGTGDQEQPTDPVATNETPAVNYRPSVLEVAFWLRQRTMDGNGNQLGTFTNATEPTGDQVEEAIDQAVIDVYDIVGASPVKAVSLVAKKVTTLAAAMAVELSYFGSQITANRSPYNELKTLYDERLKALTLLLRTVGADDEPGTADDDSGAGMPSFSFGNLGGCHVPGAESPWPEQPSWFGLGGGRW